MIKNILYVEDGSVDVDDLEDSLGEETKIIIYRQGSKPPILEQPKEPIRTQVDDLVERQRNAMIYATNYLCEALQDLEMSDEVRDKIERALTELN